MTAMRRNAKAMLANKNFRGSLTVAAHKSFMLMKMIVKLPVWFTGVLFLYTVEDFGSSSYFSHDIAALFNFKWLKSFSPTVPSAMHIWLMMLRIRTSSEFVSHCVMFKMNILYCDSKQIFYLIKPLIGF